MDLRLFGVAAVIINALFIAFIGASGSMKLSRSISQHGSMNRKSFWFFAFNVTISAIVFYVFINFWLIPTLHLPSVFATIAFISLFLQLGFAWVPDSTGLSRNIHHLLAYTWTATLLPLPIFIAFGAAVPVLVKLIAIAALAYMLVACLLLWLIPVVRKYYLILQSLFILAFQVTALAAAFIRP